MPADLRAGLRRPGVGRGRALLRRGREAQPHRLCPAQHRGDGDRHAEGHHRQVRHHPRRVRRAQPRRVHGPGGRGRPAAGDGAAHRPHPRQPHAGGRPGGRRRHGGRHPQGPQHPDDPRAARRPAHRRGEHQLAQPDRHQRPLEGHARGRGAPREGAGRREPGPVRGPQRERPLPQPLHAHDRGALRGGAGLRAAADEGRKRRESDFQLHGRLPLPRHGGGDRAPRGAALGHRPVVRQHEGHRIPGRPGL